MLRPAPNGSDAQDAATQISSASSWLNDTTGPEPTFGHGAADGRTQLRAALRAHRSITPFTDTEGGRAVTALCEPAVQELGQRLKINPVGELAGHERRGSLQWPARSALIGLMGAALGIRRDGNFGLLDGLSVAVAIFDAGAPLRDYHTVETVPSAASKRPNSRPQALLAARGKTNTMITLRDYRVSPLYGIAVWGGGSGYLDRIAQALRTPHFTLYLGRKSCPLSAPTGAKVIAAETPEKALTSLDVPSWRDSGAGIVAYTLAIDDTSGEIVHDVPIDRSARHFAPRSVAMRPVEIVAGGRK